MNIIFYIIIFILGTILGSLYANIIQRIVKEKRVFSFHSYCDRCGEKLKLFEQIPIFSYIFLKGKCKKCNKKIDIQYIILEILMGVVLWLTARGLQLSFKNINIISIISFIFLNLYISYIILVIGLDKQKKNIPASLLAYGIIVSILYTVSLCITEPASIYRNVLYLIIIIILLLISALSTKKRAQDSYLINLLTTLLIMLIFTEKLVCVLTINETLMAIALYILIHKMKKSKLEKKKAEFGAKINILFIMGILNVITFLALINIVR